MQGERRRVSEAARGKVDLQRRCLNCDGGDGKGKAMEERRGALVSWRVKLGREREEILVCIFASRYFFL